MSHREKYEAARGPAQSAARGLAMLLVMGAAAHACAGAPMRSSASYAMQFDQIAQGGGQLSSPSFAQPLTAVGQDPPWGEFVSASHTMQTGGAIWGTWVPVKLSAFTIE